MHELDARDIKCPMPIVKLSKKVKEINVGEEVKVYANDPVFKADVEAWCRKTKNELVQFAAEEGFSIAVIRKMAD